jgi:hypothetical protein
MDHRVLTGRLARLATYVETMICGASVSRSNEQDLGMLEIVDDDKGGATQDDEYFDGAVQVLAFEACPVRLHDQGDLGDDESEPEECNPGSKPREEGAVVRELAIH